MMSSPAAATVPEATAHLRASAQPLSVRYDTALLDLDGVVYVGAEAVAGAPAALASARSHGMQLAFVTNNASRMPDAVATHLNALGVPAKASDVVTSAQTAARYLAERLPRGARVLVLGTDGLAEAVRVNGLVAVDSAEDQPDAVVQGYSPDIGWRALAEGSIAIGRGVQWVATNGDATLPSGRGLLPGNGSLVAALRHATGRSPVVVGKPHPAMHRESVLRSAASCPIVVGDRLDTDIEGANAAGCDSLLVLTGTTDPALLLGASPDQRPTYVARDVGGLLQTHPRAHIEENAVLCGEWVVSRDCARTLRLDSVTSSPSVDASVQASVDDPSLDALRAICTAAWAWRATPSAYRGGDEISERVLVSLRLAA